MISRTMTGAKGKRRLLLLTGASLVALAALAGGWHLLRSHAAKDEHRGQHRVHGGVAHAQGQGTKKKKLYTCGMHPNVIQQGPGTCPICAMDLTPLKGGKSAGAGGTGPAASEGTVTVDPVMVQNMGVRVAHVKRGALSRRVRTIGEVVVAEDLVSVVNLKYAGWIERLHVDRTGIKVRRGQPLLSVYSPDLVSAQEEYLLALRTGAGRDSPLYRSARARLSFWDVGDKTLKQIEQRGKARRTLIVRAPRSGYVLHKSVVQGAKVNAGEDLFRIGKLDVIWIHAQLYEFDAPWVRLGQKATMELSFEQGRQYSGKVRYIYPTLDRKTRTLTVRLEFVNPGLRLKPGMFATVWIETRQRSGVLTVPTEAILRSGERNIVFVSTAVGKYAPRQVVTGMAGDGHVTEVKSGLKEGETVVVSGQFLLDSESQLQEAMQKLLAARLQVRGGAAAKHDRHPHGAPPSKAKKKDVWTCPMHPQIVEDKAGICPICGMDLVERKAK